MNLALNLQISLMRNFCRFKSAKVFDAPINHDGSAPLLAKLANTKQTGFAAFRRAMHVLRVHASAGITKVAKPVVAAVAVHMVNITCRPNSVAVKPCKPMGFEITGIHSNYNVTIGATASSPVANFSSTFVRLHSPNENARFGIVVKKLAQALRGKIGLSHDALLMLIGQRPACVSSTCGLRYFSGLRMVTP